MISAFVFGKFLPFHKGHEAMIDFALQQCGRLTVLVCCSDKENVPGAIRRSWIESSFTNEKRLTVQVFDYSETVLPNTSQSDEAVSKVWAAVFKKLLPQQQLLISSEPYGDFVASFMNIRHIPFDMQRKTVPVSSTAVRTRLADNWNYLPAAVKSYYAIKVVLLGTESTGKTTLAQKLSAHYNCSAVSEAGRDIIENSNHFDFEDLAKVAAAHAQGIEAAVRGSHPLIIIDTDIHITKSYSLFMFNKTLNTDEALYNSNKAQLYLYLTNDAPYFQDGTRLEEEERNRLDASHRMVLAAHQVTYTTISGSWEERFNKAVALIDALLVKSR